MARPNLGELDAFTQRFIADRTTDNIFNENVLLMKLEERKEFYPGGTPIQENLLYDDDANDTTGGSIERTATLNHVEREGYDAAQFEASLYFQGIVLWKKDVLDNKNQLHNLVTNRHLLAEKRFKNRFTRHAFAARGATQNLFGLKDLFSTTNTYGGISRSSNTFWQPQIDANSGTGRALTTQLLNSTYHDVSDGNDRPTVGITTSEVFVKIIELLMPNQRYQNTTLAEAGFVNIMWLGTPVIIDKHTDTDSTTRHKLYWLNCDYLKFRVHSEQDMVADPTREMENGAGTYTRIWRYFQLTCNNSRRQGSIEDIDPNL